MRAAALSQLTETTSLRFLGGDCAELLRLVDLIPIGSRRAASDRAQAQAVERAPAPAADLASPPVASMSTSAVTTEAGHVAERGPSSKDREATVGACPDHHVPKPSWLGPRFRNPWPTFRFPTFSDMRKLFSSNGDSPDAPRKTVLSRMVTDTNGAWLLNNARPTLRDIAARFPVVSSPDFDALANPPQDAVQAMWVGHATCLVQMEGATFITDPVFSERASPVRWAGPKRLVPVPFEIEDPRVPDIDFVLLSHAHYDHLDVGSVQRIHARWGDDVRWYVPLGLRPWFKARGVSNVVEMDWWEEVKDPKTGLTVIMTPAQHWSNRYGFFDFNWWLWGGFAVRGERLRFWFAGDTGYCEVFEEIGQRLGPFDLAAVPIGAYDPRWFMRSQHCDPGEAVLIHRDVRARMSIPIHWGTFVLTTEALDEPPLKLEEACREYGVDQRTFRPLQHGELVKVAQKEPGAFDAVRKMAAAATGAFAG